MIELTRIPSALIRLAVKDMKKTLKAGILIDMSSWGSGHLDLGNIRNCSVCFAGSVMLQTTRKEKRDISTFNANGINSNAYDFLDHIRSGSLLDAMGCLNVKHPMSFKYAPYAEFDWVEDIPDWEDYDEDIPNVFFKQLEKLAKYFKALGI